MKIFKIFIKFILLTILIFGGIIFIFSRLKEETYFYKYDLKDELWKNNVNIEFNINSSAKYKTFLLLRHNSTLENKAILCKIAIQDSIDNKNNDTLKINFIDKNGRWEGKGLSLKTIILPIAKDSIIFKKGYYNIKIEPLLTNQKLKGIETVGIILKRNKY